MSLGVRHLNISSPGKRRDVCGGLKGTGLPQKVCHWGWTWRGSLVAFPVHSFPVSCLWFKMLALNFLFLSLPAACCLLPAFPTVMDSYPGSISPNTLFLLMNHFQPCCLSQHRKVMIQQPPQLEEVVQNLGFHLTHLAIPPSQTIFSFPRSLQVTVPKSLFLLIGLLGDFLLAWLPLSLYVYNDLCVQHFNQNCLPYT